jgi:acetyl esterase/lipase
MRGPRRTTLALLSCLPTMVLMSCPAWGAEAIAAQRPAATPIWQAGAPGSDPAHWPSPDYHEEWEKPDSEIRGVTQPTIEVFLPDPAINTGIAVILCPGGGYRKLCMAKEGWVVAAELQRRGIAGIVLKYRHYDIYAAVQDAHRAVRYVRSRAREWRLNDKAIGIGGFSAGGHLAIHMAAQLGRPEGWDPDELDRLSKRPDFLMLVYPGTGMPPDAVVDATFPPSFLTVAANDDRVSAWDCYGFFSRLQALKVPSEIHIYETGGHGFGAGRPECRCASWLDLFRDWIVGRMGSGAAAGAR